MTQENNQEKNLSPREFVKSSFILNLFMANFSTHVIIMSLIMLSPAIQASMRLGYVQIALIFACMVIGDVIGRSIFLALQLKLSIHHLILLGSIITPVSALCLSLSNVLFFILLGTVGAMAGRAFIGAATKALSPFSPALIVRYGGPFSMLMSSVLIAILLEYEVDWQMIFFLLMPLGIVVIFMNKPFLDTRNAHAAVNNPWLTLPIYFKNKQIWGISALYITFRLLSNTSLLWLPLLISDGMGKNLLETGIVIIISLLLYGCSRTMLPFIQKIFSASASFMLSSSISITILAAGWAISSSFVYILGLNGLAAGLLQPAFNRLTQSKFTKDNLPYLMQPVFLIASLFDIIFHIIIGALSQGLTIGAGFLLIPLAAAFCLIYGIISMWKQPDLAAVES